MVDQRRARPGAPRAADLARLTPWRGEALEIDRHQNNLWCRLNAFAPWILDVTIGEGSNESWIYRRDAAVQLPWDSAVLVDAAEVIPTLNASQRDFLACQLAADHPWQRLLV